MMETYLSKDYTITRKEWYEECTNIRSRATSYNMDIQKAIQVEQYANAYYQGNFSKSYIANDVFGYANRYYCNKVDNYLINYKKQILKDLVDYEQKRERYPLPRVTAGYTIADWKNLTDQQKKEYEW